MNDFSRINPFLSTDQPAISVIVPCFNEEEVLEEFNHRIIRTLNSIELSWEIIYVDDGSSDHTAMQLQRCTQSSFVRSIHLSRNFGKEAALCAGLDSALGQAIIFIDADLQDPPELIPSMITHWQQGFEVINMQRKNRQCDSLFKRVTASTYYRLMHTLNPQLCLPTEVSDFRLLGPRAVSALRSLPERSRMTKGLIGWLGFKTIELPYERAARAAGETKWNYAALSSLAIEGIVSFSRLPLRWFSYCAGLFFLFSVITAIVAAFQQQLDIHLLTFSFLAFIASGVALVGEYVGAILEETKQRPHYLIARESSAIIAMPTEYISEHEGQL